MLGISSNSICIGFVRFFMNCSMCMCSLKQDQNFCEILSSWTAYGNIDALYNIICSILREKKTMKIQITNQSAIFLTDDSFNPPHIPCIYCKLLINTLCALLDTCQHAIFNIRFQINYLLVIDTIYRCTYINFILFSTTKKPLSQHNRNWLNDKFQIQIQMNISISQNYKSLLTDIVLSPSRHDINAS